MTRVLEPIEAHSGPVQAAPEAKSATAQTLRLYLLALQNDVSLTFGGVGMLPVVTNMEALASSDPDDFDKRVSADETWRNVLWLAGRYQAMQSNEALADNPVEAMSGSFRPLERPDGKYLPPLFGVTNPVQ